MNPPDDVLSANAEIQDPVPEFPVDLHKHVWAAKWFFGGYAVGLITFWGALLLIGTDTLITTIILWVGFGFYCALIWKCTIIQDRLFKAGLYRHPAWHVVVGGLILNPCVLGWIIPTSVLYVARQARQKSERSSQPK